MKHKIMLVEDDLIMLELLTTLLSLEGYDVVWVEREEGFFDILKESNPDLILMDVHLRFGSCGEINGFDLLKKYKMEPCLQKTKVIMISGMDLREKSKKAGADDFIIKPFMPDELIKKIKKLTE